MPINNECECVCHTHINNFDLPSLFDGTYSSKMRWPELYWLFRDSPVYQPKCTCECKTWLEEIKHEIFNFAKNYPGNENIDISDCDRGGCLR